MTEPVTITGQFPAVEGGRGPGRIIDEESDIHLHCQHFVQRMIADARPSLRLLAELDGPEGTDGR